MPPAALRAGRQARLRKRQESALHPAQQSRRRLCGDGVSDPCRRTPVGIDEIAVAKVERHLQQGSIEQHRGMLSRRQPGEIGLDGVEILDESPCIDFRSLDPGESAGRRLHNHILLIHRKLCHQHAYPHCFHPDP